MPFPEAGESWLGVILFTVGLLAIPCLFFGAYVIIKVWRDKTSTEYDYVLNAGKLRIVKIFNRRRRKKFLYLDVKSFEVMGKIDSKSLHRYESMRGVKKRLAVVNFHKEDDIYFVFIPQGEEKMLLYFEPDEGMIRAIRINLAKDIMLKE
jgi:hypothetical protein